MSSPPPSSVPDYVGHDDKLPIGVKLAYGMPNFAGAAMAIPIYVHMPIFYSDVVLLPLGYIALAVAIARAFDAITDPIMGWISDRTNTRWGRRRPWMLLGAPLCALAFFALFTPPPSLAGSQAAIWFTGTFMLYFLFHTVYSIPHYGLGPELTLDYNERSSLFGWMEGFSVLGTMVAAASPMVLIPMLGGERPAFSSLAATFGVLLTILYVWQCIRIKERPDFYTRKANPIVPGVQRVMRNRPFRVLLGVYVMGSITGAIPALLMPYYTRYVLQPENPDTWLGIFLLTYFAAGLLFMPLWIWAARRWGKKTIYLVTFANNVTSSAGLFFLGPGDLIPTLLLLMWSGSVFGVRLFLGPAMQADVIDYDELYTGKRREAAYGSLWAIVTKFVVIPSASVPLAILAGLGYVPNVQQSETVQLGIRAIFGLGPAAASLLAFFLAIFFPINERVHRSIMDGIARHKKGESAIDPLTGRTVPPPGDRGVDEDTGWFLDHFSQGELRRTLTHAPGGLRRNVTRIFSACVAIFAVSLLYVANNVGDLSQRPPILTVLAVVIGGFAMSGIAFHGVRLRALRRFRSTPVSEDAIREHLLDVDLHTPEGADRSGGQDAPPASAASGL